MITLKSNYSRNLEILKENIKRGMSFDQVKNTINSQEKQFISSSLYKQDEKDYINEMRSVMINSFTSLKVAIL